MPFSLSDGVNNMLTNFKNGTWALIDDVPTNETVALTVDYPEEFDTVCQSSTAASAGNCFMKTHIRPAFGPVFLAAEMKNTV